MHLIPTILSGGAGSRLWPVSRALHPKPFIRLSDNQSLLQKVFIRAAQLQGVQEILSVTNRELYFKTEDEYREINTQDIALSFILEPFGRNTAAAVAAAAVDVHKRYGDDAVLLILPADHLIENQQAFQKAVAEAINLAQQDKLVTFGIQPLTPETGYGYIAADGNNVLKFIEKPTLEKAQEYLAAGNYYWNSGMFCFKASTILQQMEQHCPDILTSVKTCFNASQVISGKNIIQIELESALFEQIPEDSIDYALFEKSNEIAMVPSNMEWNDIGSWSALAELVQEDEQSNRIIGEVFTHKTTNCTIQSQERTVGTVGIDNIIIIDTPDALLVADKSHAQDVKQIYSQLKARDHEAHKLHRTVMRPWGSYTVLEEGKNFKIKRIEVKPGASLSLQMHHHRSEHWVVVSGRAKVVNGDKEMMIKTNESTYIPAGHKHRLENPTTSPLVIIEVQSGEYLGEDDIVRFEDVYGRVKTLS